MLTTDKIARDEYDLRFSVPLYTIPEAAQYLGVPRSTFTDWVRGHGTSRPVVSTLPSRSRHPEISFVGLAEGMVATAFRQAGVSMQHIRRSLSRLQDEMGLEHALASKKLYTDGVRILYDYAKSAGDDEILTVVLSGQRVFTDVVLEYLRLIEYAPDSWANRIRLPIVQRPILEVDPRRAFGKPLLVDGGARMEDLIDRFRAGESMTSVAKDFGVPLEDVEDVIRATLPTAA